FVGFGELGSSLAEGLRRAGPHLLRAYTRERPQPAAAALDRRLRLTAVRRSQSLEEALAGASAVLSVVPPGACREVAERCAPLLDRGVYFIDFAAAAVGEKEASAALIASSGALYVDAAVLGTVATSGYEVPIVASGEGAAGWQALLGPEAL